MADPRRREVPRKINLGSGKSWQEDYLNVDINPMWRPDICLDMSVPDLFSRKLESERFGPIQLLVDYFDEIIAVDVLEHVHDVVTLMTHCLQLLRNGGSMKVLVPFDLSYGAWQDPTHVRAFNERSWLYYTDWYWYLGWREARFDLADLQFALSEIGQKLSQEGVDREVILRTPRAIDSMRATLTKRSLTDAERAAADKLTRRV